MSDASEYNEGLYADENVAADWIAWIEGMTDDPREKEIYPALSAWIATTKPHRILEIGSGQGVCSEKILPDGAAYTGIEPSAHLRARAQVLYPGREFRAGRAEALPVPDGSVDAAFSVFVWFHLQDLSTAAKELARVLAPGGAFAIVTANPAAYDLWIAWHKDARITGKELRGDMEHLAGDVIYLHTLNEMKTSLADSGLIVSGVQECGYEDDRHVPPGFALIISGRKG